MLKNRVFYPVFDVRRIPQKLVLGSEIGKHDFRLTHQFLKNDNQEVFTSTLTQ